MASVQSPSPTELHPPRCSHVLGKDRQSIMLGLTKQYYNVQGEFHVHDPVYSACMNVAIMDIQAMIMQDTHHYIYDHRANIFASMHVQKILIMSPKDRPYRFL